MSIPQYTLDRDYVLRIAGSKPEMALKIARGISEPWFRCQALSAVAEHTQDQGKRNKLISDAFDSALETSEPNRIVSVSSWPLSILCRYGETSRIAKETDRLLKIISTEPSPVRRSDALSHLLMAFDNGPSSAFKKVFIAFKDACFTPLLSGKPNKKGQSRLAWRIGMIHSILPDQVSEIMDLFHSETLRQNAMRSIANFNRKP